MAITKAYNIATSAPGTKILAGVTGFIMPDGCAGILAIAGQGAGLERIDILFPGGEFPDQEVPIAQEIAVETQIEQAHWTPCFWRLPPKTRIDIVPQGAGTAEMTYFIKYARPGELSEESIHWVHHSINTATVTDNLRLFDVPDKSRTLKYVVAHGADMAYQSIRFGNRGYETVFQGNHAATNACAQWPGLEYIGEDVGNVEALYYGSENGSGTGGASDFYFGFT